MSLFNVTKFFRVTMDSADNNAIVVHRRDNTFVRFVPSGHGLYHYALADHESISTFWSFVSTVEDQKDAYTARAISQADAACKLQNITMRPSLRDMETVVISNLKNCPVTVSDLRAAKDIYGPNLGSLKGITVH